MNCFKGFLIIPKDEKYLLVEAIVMIFLCKLLLLVLPFRKVIGINFGKKNGQKTNPDPEFLMKIKRSLRRANRLSFWRNKCLVQSIAGKWMLKRWGIKSQISFGIKYENNYELVAHAWLKVGCIEIVEKGGDYLEFDSHNILVKDINNS